MSSTSSLKVTLPPYALVATLYIAFVTPAVLRNNWNLCCALASVVVDKEDHAKKSFSFAVIVVTAVRLLGIPVAVLSR